MAMFIMVNGWMTRPTGKAATRMWTALNTKGIGQRTHRMEKAKKIGLTVPNMRETTAWAKNMVTVFSSGPMVPSSMASSYRIT
jgi:hypothetical protein